MKNDIQNRSDLYLILKLFYKKLMKDDILHPFFTQFNDKDVLEEHLQELVNFWDNTLFYSGGYRKNAMEPHLKLHRKTPIEEKHFNSWLSSFNSSVDDLFEGENSQTIKSRALSIATVMKIKISELNK